MGTPQQKIDRILKESRKRGRDVRIKGKYTLVETVENETRETFLGTNGIAINLIEAQLGDKRLIASPQG